MSKTEIFYDLPFAQYRGLDGENYSRLRNIGVSPLEYRYRAKLGDTDTRSKALGRLAHECVLEPESFERNHVVWRGGDRRSKEYKDWEKAQDGRGLEVITEDDEQLALGMRAGVYNHAEAFSLLQHGRAEVSVQVSNPDGRLVKARLDYIKVNTIVDLKTTSKPVAQFERELVRWQYHIQLAYYRGTWALATGEVCDCYIVAVESKPPHDVGVFHISDPMLDDGDEVIGEWFETLSACEYADAWPGALPGIQCVDVPAGDVELEIAGEEVQV